MYVRDLFQVVIVLYVSLLNRKIQTPIPLFLGNGHLVDNYCGLSHMIPFNGSIYGEPCHGIVSDWDSDGCVLRGEVSVRSHTCSNLIVPLGK